MQHFADVYIVAGPNGSGKTHIRQGVSAQLREVFQLCERGSDRPGIIAFEPRIAAIKAGRLVLSRIHDFAKSGSDFGFETTLSGRTHLNMLRGLKAGGYRVHIFFLWLPGVELSLLRIKDRVLEGGHNVPSGDVRRRFTRSISNFFTLTSLWPIPGCCLIIQDRRPFWPQRE